MRILVTCSLTLLLAATNTASAQLAPPFGGVPSGGNIGVGFGGGGVSGSLGLSFGQSSSRSITSSSASVTTMDGVPGFFSDTIIRPFVTGYVPIVGDYPQPLEYYQSIHDSQNQRARDRAYRSQENIRNRSLDKYLRRAYRAEEEGNKKMARANYRRAISLAREPLRSELKLRMKAMLKR